jgi:hypothetical protein
MSSYSPVILSAFVIGVVFCLICVAVRITLAFTNGQTDETGLKMIGVVGILLVGLTLIVLLNYYWR